MGVPSSRALGLNREAAEHLENKSRRTLARRRMFPAVDLKVTPTLGGALWGVAEWT